MVPGDLLRRHREALTLADVERAVCYLAEVLTEEVAVFRLRHTYMNLRLWRRASSAHYVRVCHRVQSDV